eukprot:GHVS01071351.1.p1 GENE.GHVS01071351.1~~GHVS01071351.1.p1  ORF type:complete len:681 (+),score=109.70 GHVS01071351.1:185-2227(+)
MESVLKMSVWFVVCICLAWNASASLESSYHRSLQPIPPNVFTGEAQEFLAAQADVLLELLSFNPVVGSPLLEIAGVLTDSNRRSTLLQEELAEDLALAAQALEDQLVLGTLVRQKVDVEELGESLDEQAQAVVLSYFDSALEALEAPLSGLDNSLIEQIYLQPARQYLDALAAANHQNAALVERLEDVLDVGVFLQEQAGILNRQEDSVFFMDYLRDMNKDDTMISGQGLDGGINRVKEMVQAMSTVGSAHAVDRDGMLVMKDILGIAVAREANGIGLSEREELGSNVKFGSLLNRRGSSGLRGEVGVLEGMGTSAQLDSFVSVLDPLGSLARGIANLTKIVYPFVDILVLPTQLVSSVIGSALSDFSKSLKQINIPGMMEASYFMELSASLMRIAELVQKSNATMGELSDEHGEMLSVMKSKGDSLFTFGGLLGNDTLSMFGAFEIVEDSYEYILDVLGAANNITNDGVPEWLNRDTAVRDSWMNLLDVRRVLELEGVIKRAIENIGEEAQPSSSGIFAWKPKMSHNSTKTGTTAGWAKPTLFPLEKTNLTNGFIKPTLFPVDLGSLKPFLKPTTTTTTGSTTTTRTADKSTTTSTTATTSSSTTSSSTTSSSTTSSSTTSSSTTSSTTASTTTTSTSTTRTTDKSTTRTTASTTRPSTTGGITVTTTAATEASATVGG